MIQMVILDQVVCLQHHDNGRSATLYVPRDDNTLKCLGLLEYNRILDAYTSSIDRDPRSLADQLELMVRRHRREVQCRN